MTNKHGTVNLFTFSFEIDAPNIINCAPKIFSCAPKNLYLVAQVLPNSNLNFEPCMISWFVLMLELSARLQNTWQYICSDQKKLENQSANLQANSGLEGILSRHFCSSEEGFKVRTALSLFTVNNPCQLPFVNFDNSLRPAIMHTYELGQSWGT